MHSCLLYLAVGLKIFSVKLTKKIKLIYVRILQPFAYFKSLLENRNICLKQNLFKLEPVSMMQDDLL